MSLSHLDMWLCPTHRLVAWLLRRLEMALPQPALRAKAEEQVGAGLGERGPCVGAGGLWGAQARMRRGLQREPSPPSRPSLPLCTAQPFCTPLRTHACRAECAGSALPVSPSRGGGLSKVQQTGGGAKGGASRDHQGRLPSGGGLQAET